MRRRYQELFKQINQYQRGRKFTARATGREIDRESEREGGERERKKKKISPGSIRADLANFFKVVCQFIIFQFSPRKLPPRAHVQRLQASLLFCFSFFVLHARCLKTEFGQQSTPTTSVKKLLFVSLSQNCFRRVNMGNTHFNFQPSILL